MTRTRLHAALLGALLAASAAQAALHRTSARSLRYMEPVPTRVIAASVPAPAALRFMALGHNEALADLMWLNALSFFGANLSLRKDPTWLNPHLDAITTLDPGFALVYSWAGTAILYGGRIDNDAVMASSDVLERGIARFPYAWDLHFMLGVNYYFEYRPADADERARVREYGARMVARAASLPNAPPFLRPAAASMLARRSDVRGFVLGAEHTYLWTDRAEDRNALAGQLRLRAPADRYLAILALRSQARSAQMRPEFPMRPAPLFLLLHPDPALGSRALAQSESPPEE